MQFTIDTAQRNYLLSSYLRNKQREENSKTLLEMNNSNVEITMLDKGVAMLAGAAMAGVVTNIKQVNSKFFLTRFEKIKTSPTYEESQKAAESMLKDADLKSKGVKVLFINDTPEEMDKASDIIQKNTFKNFRKKFNIGPNSIMSKIIKVYADLAAPLITKGKKASYLINEKVAITSKSTHQQIFHEIGHAKVAENKFLRPILTVGKQLPLIALISGVCALSYTPKLENPEKPKTLWEKTQNFLDNHSGKIVFATYMPLLAEKYIASKHGLKQIEKNMDKQKFASVRKLYRVGLVTYMASIFSVAAGVGLGNKVQNNIIKQKQSPNDVVNLLI